MQRLLGSVLVDADASESVERASDQREIVAESATTWMPGSGRSRGRVLFGTVFTGCLWLLLTVR